MRFVPVKSEDTQALPMPHKAREFLLRQQTRIVNAMRAHPGAFGIVVPKGIQNVGCLIEACDNVNMPAPARKALNLLADQLVDTQKKPGDDWLWKITQRKNPRQAAIALANRMVRTVYALLKTGTEYRVAQAA